MFTTTQGHYIEEHIHKVSDVLNQNLNFPHITITNPMSQNLYEFSLDYDNGYDIIKRSLSSNFDDEDIDFSCPFIRGFDIYSNHPSSATLSTPSDDLDTYLENLSDFPLPPTHLPPTPADEDFILSLEQEPSHVRFSYPSRSCREGFTGSKSNGLRKAVLKREATSLVNKLKLGDVHQQEHRRRWEGEFWSHWVKCIKDVN
jgi:hypothetical protein